MSTMTERVSVQYAGESTVEVFAGANPDPGHVAPGGVVVVDEWAATALLNSGGPWTAVGAAPDGVLTGKALNAALKAAGLPTTGTAAEKRARLVELEAAQVEADDEGPNAPEVDPPSATDDDTTETDA